MNLEKAIENNTILLKHDYWTMTPINFDSIKLGNEALKRLQIWRPPSTPTFAALLPGETNE